MLTFSAHSCKSVGTFLLNYLTFCSDLHLIPGCSCNLFVKVCLVIFLSGRKWNLNRCFNYCGSYRLLSNRDPTSVANNIRYNRQLMYQATKYFGFFMILPWSKEHALHARCSLIEPNALLRPVIGLKFYGKEQVRVRQGFLE